MKLTTITLLAASLFSTTFVGSSPTNVARTAQTCGNPSDAVPFLRAFDPSTSDHFYTTDLNEMNNAVATGTYNREQNAARVFTTQELSTVPFYRLFNIAVWDHFYTTSAADRDNAISNGGYVSEGIAAYIYTNPDCGGVPLFRLFNPATGDHFYTMSAGEKDFAVSGGYVEEGIAGYTLSP
ncbi:hypothetical protein VKT23_017602 [Stygiomarasmius scandens]|uniref:DUF5648 domain-containing protein n=1 Tax=Marasmiellus scandens TaxID=2682957 RepID=A0ABR1IRX7_9AGAR